ncbi:hypothetical protein [Bhargavaea beijingensis]|uniref:Uncharacterized protein n=1 Tax=Bhargavaea beijingensis TaxID=426756 RepID=A0A1G6ZS20_9BACL|nr:hypothetical protein [Bhargavaea beijingensis]RSK35716.1 hypothetical protein EJA12_03830 [Bhargavaea beijingensis]SDE05322.1 hypothetical protein SAMN04488126_10335 [Bhargavaea beijingensis]
MEEQDKQPVCLYPDWPEAGGWLARRKKREELLEHYYPKRQYEKEARREMSAVLSEFEEKFRRWYPALPDPGHSALHQSKPRRHSRGEDVREAVRLYRAKNIGYGKLSRIHDALDLYYLMEAQSAYYKQEIDKAAQAQKWIGEDHFSGFFPDVAECMQERLKGLVRSGFDTLLELQERQREAEQTVQRLVEGNGALWARAAELASDILMYPVRQMGKKK